VTYTLLEGTRELELGRIISPPYYGKLLADLFVEIDRADTGPVFYPGPPYALGAAQARPPAPAHYLGQHNPDVYCGMLGHTKEQLVKLYQTGII
jgi:crotonobetainyl-CoA:carnitine CoA-transferase CaiB-like acyl-CoA transferase